jgi:hypothetical protein
MPKYQLYLNVNKMPPAKSRRHFYFTAKSPAILPVRNLFLKTLANLKYVSTFVVVDSYL